MDEGILTDLPVLEFHGWSAVARGGGFAVLPWRRMYLEAQAAGTQAGGVQPVDQRFAQALVRVQKGRAGTEADLAAACAALMPRGTLAITGANEVGIDAWIRRVQKACGQAPRRTHHRAKARVAVFTIDPARPFPAPPSGRAPLAVDDQRYLTIAPGVFSGDGLDEGTAILVAHLRGIPPAHRVLDLGCGAGHLGITAAAAWPTATALLLDADARAVACAGGNIERLGFADRCRAQWWDASEPVPGGAFELVVINPPAHAGTSVSIGAARQMIRRASEVLAPGGRVVVVANRRLPYEADMGLIGGCRVAQESGGFKILEATRE